MINEHQLSPEERELLDELRQLRNGLQGFQVSEEQLEEFTEVVASDQHDLDVVAHDINTLIQSVKHKGGFGEEELEQVREIENDDANFHQDLEKTQMLLNKSQSIRRVLDFITQLEELDESVKSLESISEKLEEIELER